MIRYVIPLALSLALAAPAASLAGSERKITGAAYSFSATTGALSQSKGTGSLRKTGDFPAIVRGRIRARTFASRVLTWSVDRRTPSESPQIPRTTLVLGVRVTSSVGGCRVGTRGRVTLVDWDERLANGRRSDRVSVRFPAGSCRAYGGTWSNTRSNERVRVEISLRF